VPIADTHSFSAEIFSSRLILSVPALSFFCRQLMPLTALTRCFLAGRKASLTASSSIEELLSACSA
jgi:hypothetical protein